MPIIKEEDLLTLYSELDGLKGDKQKLQTGFVDLKIKCNKVEKKLKRNRFIFILFLIAFLLFSLFLYNKNKKLKTFNQKAESKQLVLLDSIQKLSSLKSIKNNFAVVYSIQLGVFKNLNLQLEHNENVNFRKIELKNTRAYQLGAFLSYKTATIFKNEIKKIGLKDVFLVPYSKNNERIDIKEALVLSNEEEYLSN